ncbi:MAG: hypothetical protein JSU96_05555, partial [Acidobacteriota bacterium]
MKSEISRREFGAFVTASLVPSWTTVPASSNQDPQPASSFELRVEPGYDYELRTGGTDSFLPGARWMGSGFVPAQAGGRTLKSQMGPLWRMYRQRVIWKLDDLADWSFPSWKRFCAVVERSGAKADLGINPGRCSREVFDWLRSLDPDRFELWNHTWDHGAEGPRQVGLEYSRQYENLDICQRKVKEELGFTMRAFGPAGIRLYPGAETWVGDGDEVTYYVVRNHPELVAYFGALEFADRGPGQINSDGVLTLGGPIDLEDPDGLNTEPETRDLKQRYPVEVVKTLYPGEKPNRPPGPGNPDELIWRMEHPFRVNRPEEIDQMGAIFLQCHPWNWDF